MMLDTIQPVAPETHQRHILTYTYTKCERCVLVYRIQNNGHGIHIYTVSDGPDPHSAAAKNMKKGGYF